MTEPVPKTLHEHDFESIRREIAALDRFMACRIESVDRRHSELAAERNRAVDAALVAAKEKAAAHNDTLGAMKDQQNIFCTKEAAAAMLARVETLEKHQVAETSKDKGIGLSAAVLMQLLLAATLIISIIVYFANRGT